MLVSPLPRVCEAGKAAIEGISDSVSQSQTKE